MRKRTVRLRSGEQVSVRPIRRDDAAALAEAVEQLSEQSRYRRFHSAVPRLPEQMLGYLTDIDHHDHQALVATTPGSTTIVGVARFVRDADHPDTAELAVLVVDGWQRRGLATLLIGELARQAAQVGISQFTAEILSENTPTLALVQQFDDTDTTQHGPTTTAHIDIGQEQPAPHAGARSLLHTIAATRCVLVPRLARAMLHMSADLTRTLVLPIQPMLDQPRKRTG